MINVEFKSVLELVRAFPDEQTCIDHLEQLRWEGNIPSSPFDSTSKVYKCAGNKYRCKNTGKYFNVRTGTMFDNTKVELQKWFLAIFIVTAHKKGISSLQLGRDINVTQKTAWFMLQRIRACFGLDDIQPNMSEDVQMDETFVGGKNKNRHADKKIENSQGRSFKDKTAVLGLVSNGMVKTQVTVSTDSKVIQPIIRKLVPEGATIITDEWLAYEGLEKRYDRQMIDHRVKQYVNEFGYTTNSIEGFWSIFKRGIIGIYHFVSRKHLQKYANEFAYRYNTRKVSDSFRFNFILANSHNRLSYKLLIS